MVIAWLAALAVGTAGVAAPTAPPPEAAAPVFVELGFGHNSPTGPFYRDDFHPGTAFRLGAGVRPIRRLGVAASYFAAGTQVADSVDDATFEAAVFDAIWFVKPPAGAPSMQPRLSLGYSPSFRANLETLTYHGFAPEAAASIRLGTPKVYLGFEIRYWWVRYLRATDGPLAAGLGRERHGDMITFLVFAGLQ